MFRSSSETDDRATKMVQGMKKLSYECRLKQLHIMHSLEQRRIRGDLIETFKILKGKERINAPTFFQLTNNSKGLRGHDLKLFKPSCKTTARQKFFSICVVNEWNRLPADMISSPTVNTYFKNRLNKHRSDMSI